MVSDFLLNEKWDIPTNIQVSLPSFLSIIPKVHIPDLEIKDVLVWKGIGNGLLSLKQAYNFLHKPHPSVV